MLKINFQNAIFFIAGGKGGTGKTTTAQLIIDYLFLLGWQFFVAQVDRQARLQVLNDCDVLTIDPLLDLFDKTIGAGTTVVDLGANEVDRFATWAAAVDLDEEAQNSDRSIVAFILYNAEEQSIIEAGKTAKAFLRVLPSTKLVFVENQRIGRLELAPAGSAIREAFKNNIQPFLAVSHTLVIPAVRANSHMRFEQQRVSFTHVGLMSPDEIMAVTGLPKAQSKIVRGDVKFWVMTVTLALNKLFGIEDQA